jgi:hypothetical protein
VTAAARAARTGPVCPSPRDAPRTHRTQQAPQPGKRTAAPVGSGVSTRTATGPVVRANSDGCLAAAQRVLYGDRARWFRTEVAVNNIEAATYHHVTRAPARAALAR